MFWSSEVRLRSRLGPDVLLARIADGFDRRRFPSFGVLLGGSKPLMGWIDGINVYLVKRNYYGNAIAPVFRGTVQPRLHGSEIVGTFALPPAVRVFLGYWFICAAVFTALFYIGMIRSKEPLTQGWSLLIPLVIPAGGIVVVWLGRFLARKDEPFIRDFLVACADESRPPQIWPRPASLADLISWLTRLLTRLGSLIMRR